MSAASASAPSPAHPPPAATPDQDDSPSPTSSPARSSPSPPASAVQTDARTNRPTEFPPQDDDGNGACPTPSRRVSTDCSTDTTPTACIPASSSRRAASDREFRRVANRYSSTAISNSGDIVICNRSTMMRVLLTRCNILNDVVSVNGAVISPYSPSAKFPGRFWCVRDFSVHLASRRLRAGGGPGGGVPSAGQAWRTRRAPPAHS